MLSKENLASATLLLSMDNNTSWLDDLLDEMGWTPADLARASKIDSAVISNIRNGRREIGIETAVALAKATKKKPETILRMAGKLPKSPDTDDWVDDMSHKLTLLSPGLRVVAERFIDSMLEGEEADQRKAKPKPKHKASMP
jgi:transcriptional regulator with XRE-family HTH domain